MSGFNLSQPAGYRRFLQAQAAALFPLETFLETHGILELVPDWPLRMRRMALAADLADLDLVPEPDLFDAPVHPGEAFLFGTLYTLEGSRLGGSVIVRDVSANMPTAPVRFLKHGAGTDLWRRFLVQLEGSNAVRADLAAAADGALFAFGIFEQAAGRPVEARC